MSGEEALDRAEAEGETLLRQAGADLLDGGVPVRSKRSHHRIMMGLDPIRTPVTTKRLGARVTLIALTLPPAADAGGTHTKTIGSLAMCRAGSHGSKNTNAKINR